MTIDLSLSFLAIVLLLVISGFFSGSETALTAVSRARMHHLAQEGVRRASYVNALIADREALIGAILLGNNFVNILASALATSIALRLFAEGGIVIVTFIMTAVILIFSEVMPKTLAIARTDKMALAVAPSIRIIVGVLAPIVSIIKFITWRLLYLFGVRDEVGAPILTAHEEIRGAIDLHHQEGAVEREHQHMLGGILDLTELEVCDVMVHRKNMAVVDADGPPEELIEQILSSGHTRIPIWKDDPENIVGVLHIKKLLQVLAQSKGSQAGLDIMALVSEPWFVPDTTTLEEQVREFRRRRAHFALVVDEYGTLEGLITLEDILEEVFGSIAEAHDESAPEGVRLQADGSYNVNGTAPVRDLNRQLDWNLPDEDATTVAGLVINEARIIPDVGQKFVFYGFKFEVLRKQRNQITALRIFPPTNDPKQVGTKDD